MTSVPPLERVNVALVGLSGYGGDIRGLIEREADDDEGVTRLSAFFAPDADAHSETVARLTAAGAVACDSYDALLATDADVVWLPVPIDLHLPMTRAALAAGKPVMLEKPVAGCIDDHDAIAQAAADAGLPVLVGFQDVYRPAAVGLKKRLLAGEFGTPRAACVWGLWPRKDAYYARSSWAGRVRRGDAWVLDSPLANAMAHFVNLALFTLGPTPDASAGVTRVSGETLRGRPDIENADTFSLRVSLAGTCDLVVLLTHATDTHEQPSLDIDTDRGRLRVDFDGTTAFIPDVGEPDIVYAPTNARTLMVRRMAHYLRGQTDGYGAVATLATSRPHSVLVSAVTEFLPLVPTPATQPAEGGPFVIAGLSDAFREAAGARQTLGELGVTGLPLRTASSPDLSGYARFAGPAGVGV